MIDDRRWYLRKRILVPGVLSLLVAAASFALLKSAYVIEPAREPASAAEGVIAQLVEQDGRRVVRCVALVAAPPKKVWGVVTAYDRFGQIFPMLEEVRVQREAGGTVAMTGIARTPIGSMPFSTRVKHQEGMVSRAFWDEPGGALTANRGSWTVTAAGSGTKLEYLSEISVTKFPDLIVRAAMLRLAPQVVERVIAEAAR